MLLDLSAALQWLKMTAVSSAMILAFSVSMLLGFFSRFLSVETGLNVQIVKETLHEMQYFLRQA